MNEDFLAAKLEERKASAAFRQLRLTEGLVDFCSNDYLGLARKGFVGTNHHHGSTGSRLLTGNSIAAVELEAFLADFHLAEAALLFNSGYDANLGLLSAVPQKADLILYDKLSHASIRDGIRLGFASALAFQHNDPADLEKKLQQFPAANRFVVTESVFSMDGDQAPLAEISGISKRYAAHLIVDEAHAIGVIGANGEGLVQSLGLEQDCFARVYTYGKAGGAHGAAIVGSTLLKDYLLNFARPLIFTTAIPPSAIQAIRFAYAGFLQTQAERYLLKKRIETFRAAALPFKKLDSASPIQGLIIPGNQRVRELSKYLQEKGFDVRPILYPTVPKGAERLRIVLHAFNTDAELNGLIRCLQDSHE